MGGAKEAAWPLIRDGLSLSYVQIGLLTSIPTVIAVLVEPPLGILGDIWSRRVLILAGGAVFALSALLTASSASFWMLLLSFTLFFPASGAFVSLSQATLMDWAPDRREQNMSRWAFAGSLGAALGPPALAGALVVGASWRGLYWLFAVLAALLVIRARSFPLGSAPRGEPKDDAARQPAGILEGLRGAWQALRSREVLRWLGLLQAADLMLDVLFGYLALYLVDVAGMSIQAAALAVTLWTVTGLVGDFLIIPLMERVSGPLYLRLSAAGMAVLFSGFLLAQGFAVKLLALALLGLGRAGWYAILKARYYRSMPGRSGTAMAVSSAASVVGGIVPFALGAVAQLAGLNVAMWLLLAGPAALLIWLPRDGRRGQRP